MALFRTNFAIRLLTNYRHYSVLCKQINLNLLAINSCPIIINTQRWLFWEKERKGGYNTEIKLSNWQHLKYGIKELKQELKLFTQEVKELFATDPLLIARPGKNVQFSFLYL